MYQVPMAVWNEIAKSQALSQPWATLFRLEPDQLPTELDRLVDKPAEKAGADDRTVLAYRLVAPLLVETAAISSYLEETRQSALRSSLPEINSVNEAVMLASMEYRLTPFQQRKLMQLLKAAMKA